MESVIFVIDRLAHLYTILIFIRVILSWFRVSASSLVAGIVLQATQPIFDLVNKLFPRTTMGMIDFSPLIAFIMVDLIHYLLLLIITSYF